MKKWCFLLLILPIAAGALYMRSLASWRPKVVFQGVIGINKLLFSGDGKTLLVGQSKTNFGPDRVTSLDAAHNFRLNWTLDNKGWEWQFFASDTRILAQGVGSHNSMQMLDARTGRQLSQEPFLLWPTVSPDGQWIASRTKLRYETSPESNVTLFQEDVVIKPTSYDIQGASRSQSIRAPKLITKRQTMACSVAFSPVSQTLAIGQADQITGESYIDLYDTRTWKRVSRWSDFKPSEPVQTQEEAVQWSRDGQLLLSYSIHSFPSSKTLSLWRASDGKRLVSRSVDEKNGQFPLSNFHLQNDGRVLAMCDNRGIVMDEVATLGPHSPVLFSLSSQTSIPFALSPDGSYLLVATDIGRVYYQRLK